MTADIFNTNTDGDQPQIDPNKSYLEELVGEGRKFKTVEDLAKGKAISDNYVPILEKRLDQFRAEADDLRKQLNTGPKLQEILDRLTEQSASRDQNHLSNDTETKPITQDDINNLVNSRIQETELQRRQTENANLVVSKLKEKFGTNYKTYLDQQTSDLDMTPEQVNSMAANNPKLFIKTFGLDAPITGDKFQTPPRNQMRNDSFSPSTNKRTWAYYQKMRVENPTEYKNPKTAIQMDKDAMELGELFKDGDWNTI